MTGRDETPKVRVTRDNLVALPALAPYFTFGLLALVATPFLLGRAHAPLQAGSYRHPYVLAALHAGALGWGTSVALGALQQMTAVVGATQLHSTRWAAVAFVPYAAGVVALVWGLSTLGSGPLTAAAVGIPLGVGLVVYNVARTMQSARPTERWRIIEPFVRGALVYVVVAFVAGGALAFNLTRGNLVRFWSDLFPLHVSGAVVGWFAMLVFGISYHMLTFFGLVDKGTRFVFPAAVRRLLHGGIAAGIGASVFLHVFSPLGGLQTGSQGGVALAGGLRIGALLAFVVAAGLFFWDSREVYVRPARQHPRAVYGYIRFAHGYLLVAAVGLFLWGVAVLGPALGAEAPRWLGPVVDDTPVHWLAAGVLLGGGWLSNTILAYLHRILAFFVWHNKYWGRGREPGVPAYRDMVHPTWASAGLWLFNGGVIGVAATLYADGGILWGIGLWAIGAFVIGANLVGTMLR